ncbi:MAG: peptide chain release factor 3, partial [Alphaproteobacteria bacterium]|nr:peptide chain release factor 3 [Alphaproteobacteria bacterium]
QFDVLADRIRTEYKIPVKFEQAALYTARWLAADDHKVLKAFIDANRSAIAYDHDGDPVFLARNAWHLQDAEDKQKAIRFTATK